MVSLNRTERLRAANVARVLLAVAIAVIAARALTNLKQFKAESNTPSIVHLSGGQFLMGTVSYTHHSHKVHGSDPHGATGPLPSVAKGPGRDIGGDDERPAHRVTLSPFDIDQTEVTNSEFARFVQDTGYETDAEKKGISWVFKKGQRDWVAIQGADWRHPLGSESSIVDTMNHPVVNVSWNDASAYANWADKRLPTEGEWEYAARGGREVEIYPWGNELEPGGRVVANFWQGKWPDDNKLEDGYYYTAPVASFSPNGFGLYDMIGNAWEWTADWYREDYYKHSPAIDPKGPRTGETRVARGGSWFCSEGYCGAYRVGFRGKSPQDSSFNNVGFRCAKDAR